MLNKTEIVETVSIIYVDTEKYDVSVTKKLNQFGNELIEVKVCDRVYFVQDMGYHMDCRKHIIRSVRIKPKYITLSTLIKRSL